MQNKVYQLYSRSYSRTAIKMKDFKFINPIHAVFVSENAPESLRKTGFLPSQKGWKEHNGDLKSIGTPDKKVIVWIRTASKGGKRRVWYKEVM